jgi:RNA polymerase sigma-70 factor (ECF subfamily)
MPEEPDLDRLVRKVQAGDAAAFGEIIRILEWPVRGWVVSHCPPGGDADDVAQRAFISAFQRIGEYQAGTNFKAWIFRIVKFGIQAEWSRMRRQADYQERLLPRALAEELSRRLERPMEETNHKVHHLRACLEKLDAPNRELLSQRYDQGLLIDELARHTHRSAGAIKKHLFILRGKLQDCIAAKIAAETP